MAITGTLAIIINPFFWLIFAPFLVYLLLLVSVKSRGSPLFARKLPIASRFYPDEIQIWEVRANGWRLHKTWGRIITLIGKWMILETVDYENIMVPTLSSVFQGPGGRNVMIFISPEKGEYHPVTKIEEIKPYEEVAIPKLDSSGQFTKDAEGNVITKTVRRYIYKPLTQSQRIFWRAEYEESQKKYSEKMSFWDKLAPYAGIVLLGVFAVVLIAVLFQNVGAVAEQMAEIAKQYPAQTPAPAPPGNFSW